MNNSHNLVASIVERIGFIDLTIRFGIEGIAQLLLLMTETNIVIQTGQRIRVVHPKMDFDTLAESS